MRTGTSPGGELPDPVESRGQGSADLIVPGEHIRPEHRFRARLRSAVRRIRTAQTPAPTPRTSPVATLDQTLHDPDAPVEDVLQAFMLAAIHDYGSAEARLINFDFGRSVRQGAPASARRLSGKST